MALWSSEWLRAWSRRTLRVLTLLAAAGIVIGVAIGTARSSPPAAVPRPPSPAYERAMKACLRGEFASPEELPPGFASLREFCEATVRPEDFVPQPSQIRLADLRPLLEGLATVVVMLGVVLGATLGGADWGTGQITTLLTWEPRRLRVLMVRAAVTATTVASITVALQALLIALYRAGVALRGSAEGAPPDWLAQVAGVGLRTSAVAALLGAVALAVATLGRGTAPAVGALLAYLVGVEGFLAGLAPRVAPWLLVRNAVVAITGTPLVIYRGGPRLGPVGAEIVRTPGEAWVVLLVWLAVLGSTALAAFRLRDVH